MILKNKSSSICPSKIQRRNVIQKNQTMKILKKMKKRKKLKKMKRNKKKKFKITALNEKGQARRN